MYSALARRLEVAGYSPLILRIFTFTFIVGLITSLPDVLFNFYLLSMGFDNAVAGSLASLLRLSGFLLGIPLGIAVDRFGGIRTIQVATVVNIMVWFALLHVTDVTLIRALYFLSGVFFTAQAISILPLISRISTVAQRPYLFGLNFSVLMATNIVSALIGGRLPQWLAGFMQVDVMSQDAYRAALYAVIVLCVIVLGVLWGLEARIVQAAVPETHTVDVTAETRVPLRLIAFRLFGRTLLGFAGGIFFPFINIFLRQQYTLPDASVGTILAVLAIGATLGGVFVGRVMEWLGPRRGILLAGGVAGMTTLAVFYPNPIVFTIVYAICSFTISFIFPLSDVMLMGMISTAQRGIANSIANMLWSLGWALAAWISGMLQVESGFFWPILVSACAFFSVGIWFYVVPFPHYGAAVKPSPANV